MKSRLVDGRDERIEVDLHGIVRETPGKPGDTKPTGLKCYETGKAHRMLRAREDITRGLGHDGGWVAEARGG